MGFVHTFCFEDRPQRTVLSFFSNKYLLLRIAGSRPGPSGFSPPFRGPPQPAAAYPDYSVSAPPPDKPAAGSGGGFFGAIANLLRPPPKKPIGGANPNEPSYEFIPASESEDAKVRNQNYVFWFFFFLLKKILFELLVLRN
jgi:hypothetical protein